MKEGKTKRIDELIGAALRQMGLEKPFLEQEKRNARFLVERR